MVAMNYLTRQKETIDIKAGDVIFTAGDAGEVMYGVLAGEVQLVHGGKVLDTIAEGDIVGENVMLGQHSYQHTAIALTDCQLSVIDRHSFLWMVHETPTFATDIMKSMTERVQNIAERLA
ncbi:MAG: cyclic nucleotide-binding domain-containing protein [Chloroflexota bacterium]